MRTKMTTMMIMMQIMIMGSVLKVHLGGLKDASGYP